MLRMTRSVMAAALLLTVAIAVPLHAQSDSGRPVITGAQVSFLTTPYKLTITGRNFGTNTPIVQLQDTALTVTSSSLPPDTAAGDYLLTVQTGERANPGLSEAFEAITLSA